MKTYMYLIAAVSILCQSCTTRPMPDGPPPAAAAPIVEALPKQSPEKSVLKISVTNQDYSFIYPWIKKQPYQKSGMAVLIEGNRLIVPANLVRNQTMLELEKIASGDKSPGKLIMVDYECNLALVTPEDPKFLDGMTPLPVMDKLPLKEKAEAWQFEDNGTAVITEGSLHRAQSGFSLMSYRFNINLPSYVPTPKGTPMVSDGKLCALSTSYSNTSRTLTGISAPVLTHFLTDLDDGIYQGFPGAGFGFSLIDDPQLRSYVGLPKSENGLYVTYVRPQSPAAEAGLKKGDIVLAIDANDLDRKGQYADPDYGKQDFAHLISTKSYEGKVRKFHIWRDKKRMVIDITLRFLPVDTYPIPPYISDRGPDYIIVGGFIIQELSRQYLREWRQWESNAPQRLVHYDRNQWEMVDPGKKIVIVSLILPVQGTQGYSEFNFKVIDKVNGQKIGRLIDVKKALAKPVKRNGFYFHHFLFRNAPYEVVLDAKQAKIDEARACAQFGIRALQRFRKE